MLRSQKRLLILLAGLSAVLVIAAGIYMLVMASLEDDPRTFLESLEFAAETLSTTGYGRDSAWSHPLTVIFVVLLQFVGVFLIFMIFPIYLLPFLEERFETQLPKTVSTAVEGTVLLYRFGPAVTSLIDELDRAGVPSLVVEEDVTEARQLLDQGRRVLFGGLDEGVLERAHLESVRAIVLNGDDDENAAATLTARELGFEGDILALAEDAYHRRPMALAGATAVYTPRHLLAAALAARASERISPRVEGVQALGEKLVVSEVRIARDSEMVGKTLGEADVGRQTGVTVIGQWIGGHLVVPPTADMRLFADGILVVAGGAENIRNFSIQCGGMTLRRSGPFVVAGFGRVGQKAVSLLQAVGEATRVIDSREMPGVDLVGDIMDVSTLKSAEIEKAQAVILAVDSDSATLFATVILKDHAPQVPVIARVNQPQNVERIHRAGADFALSISQVAGQILARRLLGQEAISVNPQLRVQRVSSTGIEGRHPADLRIRETTGVSVVAVERDHDLLVDFDAEFRFENGDDVYICGSADATAQYLNRFSG
jgi:Trk K+ transport system NAD-binding subunit